MLPQNPEKPPAQVPTPEQPKKTDAPKSAEALKAEREASKQKGETARGELKENLDNEGVASQYVDTFKFHPDFDPKADLIEETVRSARQTDKPFQDLDFSKWGDRLMRDRNNLIVALDGFLPHGPGRKALLDGLKMNPNDPEKNGVSFAKSERALKDIMGVLNQHFNEKRGSTRDVEREKDRYTLGNWVGKTFERLGNSWEHGNTTQRVIMGAMGIGIVSMLAGNWKNKAWFTGLFSSVLKGNDEGFTWGKTATFVGALLGANYLWGKASEDGRMLSEHISIGRRIDDLPDDSPLKTFLDRQDKLKKDEKGRTVDTTPAHLSRRKIETFYAVQNIDMLTLFDQYKDASHPGKTGKREISPKLLGRYAKNADGGVAYELVESVVIETAVNQWATRERLESGSAPTKAMIEKRREQYLSGVDGTTKAQQVFEHYLSKFKTSPSLFDIIMYNHGFRYDPDASTRNEAERNQTVVGGAADTAGRIYEGGKGAAKNVYNNVTEYGSAYAIALWNRYVPRVKEKVTEKVKDKASDFLAQALPLEFSVTHKNQHFRVNDFPVEIPSWGPKPEEGKLVAGEVKLGDATYPFDPAKGKDDPKNKASAENLGKAIEQKVKEISAQHPLLKNASVTWHTGEKKWEATGVQINGDPALGLGPDSTRKLQVVPEDTGASVKAFLEEKEIADQPMLELAYRDEKIIRGLHRYRSDELFEGLAVEGITVHGNVIEAKLGGMPVKMAPKGGSLDSGVDLLDSSGAVSANGSGVEIVGEKGHEFVKNLCREINGRSEFSGAFERLEQIIALTDEPYETRFDAITSLNFEQGINGKILQHLWKSSVDYKRLESLRMFERALRDTSGSPQTLADIDAHYKTYITATIKQISAIHTEIQNENDHGKRAKKFQEYLRGDGKAGQMRGLEYVNYENEQYRDHFKTFLDMLRTYGYEGFDTADATAGDAYKIRQTLHSVYNEKTWDLANKAGTLSKAEEARLSTVAGNIRDRLDETKAKNGGGAIKLKYLPDFKSENDLAAWMKS